LEPVSKQTKITKRNPGGEVKTMLAVILQLSDTKREN
jgi:hypothetical protein